MRVLSAVSYTNQGNTWNGKQGNSSQHAKEHRFLTDLLLKLLFFRLL